MADRKLVTFRTVSDIRPIKDADMIELAIVDGWQLVVKKNEFNIGDRAVYCEVDSFIPCKPEFEFLRKSSYKKMGEEEGFRLKTLRLRGEISQGLLLPLSSVDLKGDENEEDLASLLGIKLYEPPLPAQLAGLVAGLFPSFIQKTDQERVQNLTGKLWGTGRTVTYTDGEGNDIVKEIPPAPKRKYEISEKMDGCFHHSTLISTDQGKLKIGAIFHQKLPVKILTYNEATKRTEYKEIEQYHYYKDKQVDCVVSVGHRGKGNRAKQIKCTQDHLFLTDKGWVEAKNLQQGDTVFHKSEKVPYEVKQLLLGCLLGDSHLHVQDNYMSISFGHCENKKEYLLYKKQILGDLFLDSKPQMGGYEGSTLISRGHTKTNLTINEFALKLCYNTVKQSVEVSKEWADALNPLSLAFWYMDDGSIANRDEVTQQPIALLHTHAFSYDEVCLLRDRLINFGITAEIGPAEVYKGYILRLNLKASEIFFSIIAPYIPPCMKYKIPKKYENCPCVMDNYESAYFSGVTPTKVLDVSFSVKDCYSHYPGSYDLTLKDNHNYFVYDILVHNSSGTLYNHNDHFGVCSRNLELKEDTENSFWKIAHKYNLKEKLSGHNVAIQGELCGEGIQKNRYRLKGQELYVFDIYDIDKRKYFSPEERATFLSSVAPEMKTVPILERNFELPDSIKELLEYAQGPSSIYSQQEREGLVFKEEGEALDRFSFKAISNSFLLKEKD
jgi:hypothetical protein